jgi:hypothetical protein
MVHIYLNNLSFGAKLLQYFFHSSGKIRIQKRFFGMFHRPVSTLSANRSDAQSFSSKKCKLLFGLCETSRFFFKNIPLFGIILLITSCQPADKNHLFTRLSPSKTGVDFANKLDENERFNIIQYLYYYNGGGVSVGDVNNDGLPDIFFTANQFSNRLYLNKGNFEFEDVTKKAGLEDVKEPVQELSPTRGWQSSSDYVLNFGLGKNQIIDEVSVTWPGGKAQIFTNVTPNQLLKISAVSSTSPQVSLSPHLSQFTNSPIHQFTNTPIHQYTHIPP